MKLLLHTCCAPCSVFCVESLRKEGVEPTLFWYNPNIHPYAEYKARRDCLKEYAKKIGVSLVLEDFYGLDEFCRRVAGLPDLTTRCEEYCYPRRLSRTFAYAKAQGYDAVSTTLLYSIYQKHDKIAELMDGLAQEYGVKFLYRDWREGFCEGQAKARAAGLYMQKYCGCIYSEEESSVGREIGRQLRRAGIAPTNAAARKIIERGLMEGELGVEKLRGWREILGLEGDGRPKIK